jgi:hypothetical protein
VAFRLRKTIEGSVMGWEEIGGAIGGTKKRRVWIASLKEKGHNAREMRMTDYRVNAGESQEDQVTAAIEQYTSKAPSSAFLALAIAAIGASVACKALKKDHASLFIGQWVAPFLLLGIYNKMVKQHGSDATRK